MINLITWIFFFNLINTVQNITPGSVAISNWHAAEIAMVTDEKKLIHEREKRRAIHDPSSKW